MQNSSIIALFSILALAILGVLGYQIYSNQTLSAQRAEATSQLTSMNQQMLAMQEQMGTLSQAMQEQRDASARMQATQENARMMAETQPATKTIYTDARFTLTVPEYCPVIAQKSGNTINVGSAVNMKWSSFTMLSAAEHRSMMAQYANTPASPAGAVQLNDGSYLQKNAPQDVLVDLDAVTAAHPQAQIECVPKLVVTQ